LRCIARLAKVWRQQSRSSQLHLSTPSLLNLATVLESQPRQRQEQSAMRNTGLGLALPHCCRALALTGEKHIACSVSQKSMGRSDPWIETRLPRVKEQTTMMPMSRDNALYLVR
jgi:hypothetical protein